MLWIKNQLLAFYTRRYTRAKQPIRTNVGLANAKAIGILYSGNSPQKLAAVRHLTTQLTTQGKTVSLLACASRPLAPASSAPATITPSDVTHWGTLTSPAARDFVHTPFDYLYHVGINTFPLLDYLLACSRAKCRVGHYSTQRTPLFELMVTLDKTKATDPLESLVQQMLHYTQLLASS